MVLISSLFTFQLNQVCVKTIECENEYVTIAVSRNLSNCKNSLKKSFSGLQRDSNPWPLRWSHIHFHLHSRSSHHFIQYYRVYSQRPCWRSKTIKNICMKIRFNSQRNIVLLCYLSNMAAMNILYTLQTKFMLTAKV